MPRGASNDHKPLACPRKLMQNRRQIELFERKDTLRDKTKRNAQILHRIEDIPSESDTAFLKIIRKINLLIFLEFYPLLLCKQRCGAFLGKLCGHGRFLAQRHQLSRDSQGGRLPD